MSARKSGFCRRFLTVLVALGLVAATSLGHVVTVVAETDDSFYMERIIGEPSGVPDDLTLVAKDGGLGSEAVNYQYLYGAENYSSLSNVYDKYSSETEEGKQAIVGAFEQIGMFFPDASEDMIDFHLENNKGAEVPYDGEDGITIRYDFSDTHVHNDVAWIFEESEKEWGWKLLHIREDNTREFLPVEIDNEGIWEFTAYDFSVFMPVYKLLDECEGKNSNNVQCGLIDYQGAPAGTKLVVEEDYEDINVNIERALGADGYAEYQKIEEEVFDDDDYKAFLQFFGNVIGYYPLTMRFTDFHLVDEVTGEEVENDGSSITIRYYMEDWDASYFIDTFNGDAERNWKPMMLHIKDDNTRELVPATIDEDGVWEFTATDFSVYIPVFAVEQETEAPKTLDSTEIYLVTTGASVAVLFILGAWLGKRERR